MSYFIKAACLLVISISALELNGAEKIGEVVAFDGKASSPTEPQEAYVGDLVKVTINISDTDQIRFYHQGYLHGFSAVNLLTEPLGRNGRYVTVLCNSHLVQKMPELAIRLSRLF